MKYVPDDFTLKGKTTYYAGKGTAKETQIRKAKAIESLKTILVDQDVQRVKLGAEPASTSLINWLEQTRNIKIDNDLIARGQMPIHSKPTKTQLERIATVNQATREKPTADLLEIQLRKEEFDDRNRILDGQLPIHRQATKKETEFVSTVLDRRSTGKYNMFTEHIAGTKTRLEIGDDKVWNATFGDYRPPTSVPPKPQSYESFLKSIDPLYAIPKISVAKPFIKTDVPTGISYPKFPGSSGNAEEMFQKAAQMTADNNKTMYDAIQAVKSIPVIGAPVGVVLETTAMGVDIAWSVPSRFIKAGAFLTQWLTDEIIDTTGRTDWKAASEFMEKEGELLWQPYIKGMDEIHGRIKAVYQDPDYNKATLKEKLTTRLPQTIQYLAPDLASSIIVFATGGAGVFVPSQSYEMYELARSYGVSKREAYTTAVSSALIEYGLEKVGFNTLMGKSYVAANASITKRVVSRILTSEAMTEGLQNVSQKAFERTFRDDLGWDEFASTTALSMVGGLIGDVSFAGYHNIIKSIKETEYNDLKTAETMANDIGEAAHNLGMIDNNKLKSDAFRSDLRKKAISNPLLIKSDELVGPSRDPINPPKIVENYETASSIRTGDKVYAANNKQTKTKIIPDVMGRHYDEYKASKIRVMEYEEAVNHIQNNFDKLTTEEQGVVRDILDFDSQVGWDIDSVARVLQIYSDPNQYNAVLVRDEIRGSVMAPFGLEYITKSADMLALRDSMINEILTDMKDEQDEALMRNFNKLVSIAMKSDEIQTMKEYGWDMKQTWEKTQELAQKVRKNIVVQKVILDKFVAVNKAEISGLKTGWNRAKKLLLKMANSQMHNVKEAQKILYAYMVRNPVVNKQFEPAEKDSIMRKIIALSTKANENSLRKGMVSVIGTIDKKMIPARLRAIIDKAVPVKTLKLARLDWTNKITEFDEFKQLPILIKAQKMATTAEMTDGNLKMLEILVDRQRVLYEDSKERMHEIIAQDKIDTDLKTKGIIAEVVAAGVRKKKGWLSRWFSGLLLANPTLAAERIGQKFYDYVIEGAKDKADNGDTFIVELSKILDNVSPEMRKAMIHSSQSFSGKKNAVTKYGKVLQITGSNLVRKDFKFSKAEIAMLYMCNKDLGARYALLGEHDSNMNLSRDKNLPSLFFTMNKAQIDTLIKMVESDPETMAMIEFATEVFRIGYEEMRIVYKKDTGRELPSNPNYIPIEVWGTIMDGIDSYIQGGTPNEMFSSMETAIGMLKERTPNVKKTVKVNDLMGVTSRYMQQASMYISYGETIKKLSRMIKTLAPVMSSEINNNVVEYWQKYIRSLNPYANMRQTSYLSKKALQISNLAVAKALWMKVTSVLKQPASLLIAGSVDPFLGVTDIMQGVPSATKLLWNKDKKQILYDIFPSLFCLKLTGFDPTMDVDSDVIPGVKLLSLFQKDYVFQGRGLFEKTRKLGTKGMIIMNDLNYDYVMATYLVKAAKVADKDINTMSFQELSDFAMLHKKAINKILMISQPQYGLVNRIPEMVDQTDWLSRTVLRFKAATLAGIDSTRRVIELRRQGRIDNITAATQIVNGFVLPAIWCSGVKVGWLALKVLITRGIYGALTDEEEKEMQEIEDAQNKLLDYSIIIASEMAGQFPVLDQLVWATSKMIRGKGKTYGSQAFSMVEFDWGNDLYQGVSGLYEYGKLVQTEEQYQKSKKGEYKKDDYKWKNEKKINDAITSGLSVLETLAGIDVTQFKKLVEK